MRAQPRRSAKLVAAVGRLLFAIVLAMISAVAVLQDDPASAASSTGGVPDWFPLRGDHLIGCSYLSPDGKPNNHICEGSYHPYWAIDIGGTIGETVYAAGKGTVYKTETHQGGNCPVTPGKTFGDCPDGSKGDYVLIDHGGGIFSFYEHLQTVTKNAGDTVDETTPIGTVGMSGFSSYPHLHFERRPGALLKSIDPGLRVQQLAGVAWTQVHSAQ
jgi:murein DD-endopeptidase MepM/ murein hydrolase activator NlpD